LSEPAPQSTSLVEQDGQFSIAGHRAKCLQIAVYFRDDGAPPWYGGVK
jgi:hypothetical protein